MVRGSLLLGGYVANLLFLQRLFGVTSSDLLFQYQRKFTSTWLDCSLLVFVYFLSSAKNFRFFPHVNSLLETTLVSDRFADHFRLDISFFSLSSVSYSTTQTTPELKKLTSCSNSGLYVIRLGNQAWEFWGLACGPGIFCVLIVAPIRSSPLPEMWRHAKKVGCSFVETYRVLTQK